MNKSEICLLMMSFLVTVMLAPTLVPSVMASRIETIVYSTQEDKWTLLIQAHAPLYGETAGTASWGYAAHFRIGPVGSFSSVEHSVTLFPYDGRCGARFQLCRWEFQVVFVEEGPFNGHNSWIEERWVIVKRLGNYLTRNIYDGSRSYCSDDQESFSAYGYESIEFQSRYVNAEWTETNDSDFWMEREVSVGWLGYIGLGISVEVEVGGFTGTGSFGLRNNLFSTWTYKYRFGPHHSWYVDRLCSSSCVWTFYTRW